MLFYLVSHHLYPPKCPLSSCSAEGCHLSKLSSMEQVTADGVTGAMVQDEEEEGMPVQVIINGATGVILQEVFVMPTQWCRHRQGEGREVVGPWAWWMLPELGEWQEPHELLAPGPYRVQVVTLQRRRCRP